MNSIEPLGSFFDAKNNSSLTSSQNSLAGIELEGPSSRAKEKNMESPATLKPNLGLKDRLKVFKDSLKENFATIGFPATLTFLAAKEEIQEASSKKTVLAGLKATGSLLLMGTETALIAPAYLSITPLLSALALADALTQASFGKTLNLEDSKFSSRRRFDIN